MRYFVIALMLVVGFETGFFIPVVSDPGADSEEKREPVSDIDIAGVDSLKVLDPKWPIREADMGVPARRSAAAMPAPPSPG